MLKLFETKRVILNSFSDQKSISSNCRIGFDLFQIDFKSELDFCDSSLDEIQFFPDYLQTKDRHLQFIESKLNIFKSFSSQKWIASDYSSHAEYTFLICRIRIEHLRIIFKSKIDFFRKFRNKKWIVSEFL